MLAYEQIPVFVDSPTLGRLVVGEKATINLTMKAREAGIAIWKYDGLVIVNNLDRWDNRSEAALEKALRETNTRGLEQAKVSQRPAKLRFGDTPYSISSISPMTTETLQRLETGVARLYFVSSIDYGGGVLWTCGYLTSDLQVVRYCAENNVPVPRGFLYW